jgi:Holliday junction resolvasome RuvABC endonuclease subunit
MVLLFQNTQHANKQQIQEILAKLLNLRKGKANL